MKKKQAGKTTVIVGSIAALLLTFGITAFDFTKMDLGDNIKASVMLIVGTVLFGYLIYLFIRAKL